MSTDVVTAERVIPAPPEKIFDLLVDPTRHREIDGSGTLVEAKDPSTRLKLGDRFGMAMKMGVPYSMVSTVIELEENRRIAWQTRGGGRLGARAGGRIWRYELEPVDGGTKVTHSYEITLLPLRPMRAVYGALLPDHRDMRPQMRTNLEALEQLFRTRAA